MKILIRLFFKLVRAIIGPLMLLWEKLSAPKPVQRSQEDQWKVDRQCRGYTLYQFKTCPFCLKVRQAMRGMALNIDVRDAQHDPRHRAELLEGGGMVQVPCLRVVDGEGESHWIYESALIIQYLHQRFG